MLSINSWWNKRSKSCTTTQFHRNPIPFELFLNLQEFRIEFLQIRLPSIKALEPYTYASTIPLVIRLRSLCLQELILLSIEDVAHKFREPYFQSQQ